MKKYKNIVFLLAVISSINCFSQTNDAIRMIMSAKKFSITEQYLDDKGSFTNVFYFTKEDGVVEIIYEKTAGALKSVKKKTISMAELKVVENLFDECCKKTKKARKSDKIQIYKYVFKDDVTTYEFDDNASLICLDDITNWKNQYFPEK